jgi:hypothetical protein
MEEINDKVIRFIEKSKNEIFKNGELIDWNNVEKQSFFDLFDSRTKIRFQDGGIYNESYVEITNPPPEFRYVSHNGRFIFENWGVKYSKKNKKKEINHLKNINWFNPLGSIVKNLNSKNEKEDLIEFEVFRYSTFEEILLYGKSLVFTNPNGTINECRFNIDKKGGFIDQNGTTEEKKTYLPKHPIWNKTKYLSKSDFLEEDLEILEKFIKFKLSVRLFILQQEKERRNELQISQTNVLSELDKDGNGEVDVVEGNDFNTLLKKHQKSIVEIDRNYVQKFVKISSYLKTKKGNIQSIFNSIKDTPNQEVLNKYVEILKDDIHTYNLILFNSLNMIVSLVEDDMITFYEIYEMFDTLNMFDSKHEKDVSQKLTNIGDGLENLMYEIRDVGNQISNSIDELSYISEESNRQLTNQLSEIDSTMKVGNLISTINTYQNYKTNRRLNS